MGISKLVQCIQREKRGGGRIGVALSGGPDSLALLYGAKAAGLDVTALVIDHGLRPSSCAEAQSAAALARKCDVPAVVGHFSWLGAPPKPSLRQIAARAARYRALALMAAHCQLEDVATGHHADDQLETVMLRLAAGSGPMGLAGMASRRPLSPTVDLWRPCLQFRKAQLADICRLAAFVPLEDPSNALPVFRRNRMRASLHSMDDTLRESVLRFSAECATIRSDVLRWADQVLQPLLWSPGQPYAAVPRGSLRNLPQLVLQTVMSTLLTRVAEHGSSRRPSPRLQPPYRRFLDELRSDRGGGPWSFGGCVIEWTAKDDTVWIFPEIRVEKDSALQGRPAFPGGAGVRVDGAGESELCWRRWHLSDRALAGVPEALQRAGVVRSRAREALWVLEDGQGRPLAIPQLQHNFLVPGLPDFQVQLLPPARDFLDSDPSSPPQLTLTLVDSSSPDEWYFDVSLP